MPKQAATADYLEPCIHQKSKLHVHLVARLCTHHGGQQGPCVCLSRLSVMGMVEAGGVATMIGSSSMHMQWESESLDLGGWVMWPQQFSGIPVHVQKLRITGAVGGRWHGHYGSATATHTKNQSHRHG